MRLVRFGEDHAIGLLVEVAGTDRVVDVLASLDVSGSSAALRELLGDNRSAGWVPLIQHWDVAGEALRRVEEQAAARAGSAVMHEVGSIRLRAPLPDRAAQIFALGGNFDDHSTAATEQKAEGLPPWGFTVMPRSIAGPADDITPPEFVRYLDYEAEVAVVLACEGTRLDAAQVQVWGYTAWHDVSIRDVSLGIGHTDRGPYTWTLAKNFTASNIAGPCLVVADEATDLASIGLRSRVNGELRQDSTLKSMVYSFGEVASFISSYLPLGAGDMILSGTPGGTAIEDRLDGRYLADGDVVEIEVDGVGVLRNRVVTA